MTDPTDPQTEDPMVAALLRERAGYVQRGMDDRVGQVDDQLRLRGYTPADEGAKEQARTEPPKGRRAQRPETA
jgi:hypothetical protein